MNFENSEKRRRNAAEAVRARACGVWALASWRWSSPSAWTTMLLTRLLRGGPQTDTAKRAHGRDARPRRGRDERDVARVMASAGGNTCIGGKGDGGRIGRPARGDRASLPDKSKRLMPMSIAASRSAAQAVHADRSDADARRCAPLPPYHVRASRARTCRARRRTP